MNFLKIKLLVIAAIIFAASSAFASMSYDVMVNTSSLANTSGYLYFAYVNTNGTSSTATVSNIVTDGLLGAQDTLDVANGSAVTGTLPGNVVFASTYDINDYNHAITFGNMLDFSLTFSNPAAGGSPTDGSTFSLALYADAGGNTPLFNGAGVNNSTPGTVFTATLLNNGTASAQVLDGSTEVTPTPIPAAAYLLGSGLMGLFGIRRRKA
ncbi:MAG: NF038129 family PEP-CTERM protein [Oryzomonas sp.]|jgi:hypothetical protein